MNERGAIGVIVAVVLVVVLAGGAGAWYFMQNRGGFSLTPSATPVPTLGLPSPIPTPTSQAQGTTLTGKITDLVDKGQNLTCTFERPDAAASIRGTVYVAAQGQRLRGDFTVEQAGAAPMVGHTLRDGQTMYVWADTLPQGTKFTIGEESPAAGPTASAAPNTAQAVIDENLTYSCQVWAVDETVFALPTNVQFVDVSAQLQQFAPGALGAPSAQQCAACNQLQEPTQSQCLAALGC